MKAPFSPYLTEIADGLKTLVRILDGQFDYVSVLATDSTGFQMMISGQARSITLDTMTTERGNVVRVCRDGLYSEAAFNLFDPAQAEEKAREKGGKANGNGGGRAGREKPAFGVKPRNAAANP